MPDYSKTKIQFRRGTAAEWGAAAPVVLASGEPGFVTDTNTLKIGDGSTVFSSLSAITGGGGGGSEVNDLTSIVTWANVPDANITESAVVQHSGALRLTESQIVDLQSYLTAETNDLTSAVTWTNVPDANITESSVVQHSGALRLTESQIVDLGDYVASGENISLFNNDSNYIISDATIASGSEEISNIISLSQSEYDLITPQTGVLYVIDDAPTPAISGENISQFTNDAGYLTSVTNIDTTNFNATAIVTEAEGIGSNDNDTTLPTSAAVKDYVDNNAGTTYTAGDGLTLTGTEFSADLLSDTSAVANSVQITNIVAISQANYNALGSYDANTLYYIT